MHERDFTVGDTIPANIDAAIRHSRRMIMVISRYEFISFRLGKRSDSASVSDLFLLEIVSRKF